MRTIHREIVGGFIISSDDKILLGKTGVYSGLWVVPGGGINPGETKLEALRREILEETGIDTDGMKIEDMKVDLTGESEKNLRDTGERVHVKMRFHNYRISVLLPAYKVKIKTTDDLVDATWFSRQELPKLNLSPPTVSSLQKLGYLISY
jgi:8-oxo-dGTP pyrophosphatase MutT (NUDIX family)